MPLNSEVKELRDAKSGTAKCLVSAKPPNLTPAIPSTPDSAAARSIRHAVQGVSYNPPLPRFRPLSLAPPRPEGRGTRRDLAQDLYQCNGLASSL